MGDARISMSEAQIICRSLEKFITILKDKSADKNSLAIKFIGVGTFDIKNLKSINPIGNNVVEFHFLPNDDQSYTVVQHISQFNFVFVDGSGAVVEGLEKK